MSRESRGRGSEAEVGWEAGCTAGGWLAAVGWVFGTAWDVLAEAAATPFV